MSKNKNESRPITTAVDRVGAIVIPESGADEDSNKKKRRGSDSTKISAHEFLIDFLGALVPGILFTIAVAFALVPLLFVIFIVSSKSFEAPQITTYVFRFLESTKNTPSAIWIGVFIFCILLSYTLGHLFYRRNPKTPDAESFKLLSKQLLEKTDWKDLAKKISIYAAEDDAFEKENKCTKQQHWLRCNFGCDNERDCEFPYPYLDKYLEERGHRHLAKLVPWTGHNRESRSKTFINRLKIRLEIHHPEACRSIIRNEAHVRLAASMWFVGRFLWKSSLEAIVVFGFLLLIFGQLGFSPPDGKKMVWYLSWCIPAALPALFVAAFASYSQSAVAKFLLYQRLREAFYVLEVAYSCFRDSPEMFDSPEIRTSDSHLSG